MKTGAPFTLTVKLLPSLSRSWHDLDLAQAHARLARPARLPIDRKGGV
jgi:hypothetical protein